MPTSTPATPYLRRGDVVSWLEGLGIDPRYFEKLVTAGTIQKVLLPKCKKAYYLRDEIEQVIIAPFREAEARAKK